MSRIWNPDDHPRHDDGRFRDAGGAIGAIVDAMAKLGMIGPGTGKPPAGPTDLKPGGKGRFQAFELMDTEMDIGDGEFEMYDETNKRWSPIRQVHDATDYDDDEFPVDPEHRVEIIADHFQIEMDQDTGVQIRRRADGPAAEPGPSDQPVDLIGYRDSRETRTQFNRGMLDEGEAAMDAEHEDMGDDSDFDEDLHQLVGQLRLEIEDNDENADQTADELRQHLIANGYADDGELPRVPGTEDPHNELIARNLADLERGGGGMVDPDAMARRISDQIGQARGERPRGEIINDQPKTQADGGNFGLTRSAGVLG